MLEYGTVKEVITDKRSRAPLELYALAAWVLLWPQQAGSRCAPHATAQGATQHTCKLLVNSTSSLMLSWSICDILVALRRSVSLAAGGLPSQLSTQMFRAGGKSIATEVGSRKRVHTTWPEDKSELIEEYDLKTNELLLRKRRTPKPLSGPGAWEYLQGEEAPGFKAPPVALAENSRNVRHCLPAPRSGTPCCKIRVRAYERTHDAAASGH